MRALLAEDDAILADALGANLQAAGFEVEIADNGAVAEYLLTKQHFDVGIIDIGLPLVDGLTVVQHVRAAKPGLPLLILTALDGLHNRVAGLNAGADDYLTKPFHTEELLARLRALLRRSAGHAAPSLSCGGLRLDPRAARASVNGEPLRLTSLEYRLLHYMIMHQGRVISRTELVEHLYDQDFDRDSNTIEVFIGRVRKKIGADRIDTVRGLGYRLTAPADELGGAAG